MGRVQTTAVILGALVVLSAAPAGTALADGIGPSGSYFDDDGNIHEGAIQAINYEGITKGCNPPRNTDYCPTADVSRGQMAAFLVRALSLPASNEDFFSDDDGSVFENDINRLAASGITRGCNPPANNRYCPDGPVTRGQMAAFLVRAFGYTDNGGGNLFTDDDASVFEVDIDRLGAAGVTRGCNPPDNDRYCPTDRVKRDQMASFLTRALELRPDPPTLDHSAHLGLRLNLLEEARSTGCPATDWTFSDGVRDVCQLNTSVDDGWDFWVEHGWTTTGWSYLSPGEQADALNRLEQQEFRLYLNGTRLDTYDTYLVSIPDDTYGRTSSFQFPWWLEGTHEIVGEWVDRGLVEYKVIANVNLSDVVPPPTSSVSLAGSTITCTPTAIDMTVKITNNTSNTVTIDQVALFPGGDFGHSFHDFDDWWPLPTLAPGASASHTDSLALSVSKPGPEVELSTSWSSGSTFGQTTLTTPCP